MTIVESVNEKSGVVKLPGLTSEGELPSSVENSSTAYVYARNYVKAEGEAHDDYAGFQEAVTIAQETGRPLVLPGGVAGKPAVIYLGVGGAAYGAIKLLPNKPLTIRGPGQGLCHFKLSRYCPRLFDLDPKNVNNLTWENLDIGGFTCDCGNVTGVVLAPETTITENKTLEPGVYTTIAVANASEYANTGALNAIWFPATNTGTCKERTAGVRYVDATHISVLNTTAGALTVKVGDAITGAFSIDHALIGNRHGGQLTANEKGEQLVANFKNIELRDIDVINLPATQGPSLEGKKVSSLRGGVMVKSPAAGGVMENVVERRVRIFGGDAGSEISGAAGVWIDEIGSDECFHDRGTAATANYPSENRLVGGEAWVGRVWYRGYTGRNSGDVGIETDNAMILDIDETTMIEDAYSGCYFATNFCPPARSIAGPPTATITTGGGINETVTAVAVSEAPHGVEAEGYVKIDNELVHYFFVTSKELTIKRGINGSTAAAHAEGATVTFIENRRQEYTLKGKSRRINSTTSHGFYALTRAETFLPLPKFIFNGSHLRLNDTGIEGEGIFINGLPAKVEIGDNYECRLAGNCSTPVSCVYINREGVTGAGSLSEVIPDPIRIGRALLSCSGVFSAGKLQYIQVYEGNWDVDIAGLQIANNALGLAGSTRAFDGGTFSNHLKLKVDMKITAVEGTDINIVGVFAAGGATTLERLDVVNLDMYNTPTSITAQYVPWQVGSGYESVVYVHSVRHPNGLSYPNHPEKWNGTLKASATVTHDAENVPVSTAEEAVTVTLPPLASTSTANPQPGTGAKILVLDVANKAGTNNITVKAGVGDKMSGVSEGTFVIKTNGGNQLFKGSATLGWWPVV